MDLAKFDFPSVTGVDQVFPVFDTLPELLAEAKARGFYQKNTPYNRLFSTLFYHGGRVVWKTDVSENFRAKAWPYCRSLMGSFAPKHEDKEAVCAMLLSEMVEPQLAPTE